MKLRKINEALEDDNWDFDMSRYEKADEKIEEITSLQKMIDNKPNQGRLRSKYSAWATELEALQLIKMKISKYAIKVAQNTSDINELWLLYGCLDEFWARIADIYGKTIYLQIESLLEKSRKELEQYKSDTALDYNTHRRLLKLRKMLYMITQRNNLGIATEMRNSNSMANAKKSIIE